TPEDTPLTEADVREYIRLRLVEHEVLTQAEADLGPLDNDENGPVARQRLEVRLAEEGQTYEAYRALETRIRDAEGAMQMERDLAETNAEMEAALAEAAAFMTPEQLAEARSALAEHDADTQAAIDRTRPDWPALDGALDTLLHLDDYTAGVRPDPPVLPASGGGGGK
ncbi:MAG: hypothetical protein AAFQ43_12785, partial [Bacteroidota bacterium]